MGIVKILKMGNAFYNNQNKGKDTDGRCYKYDCRYQLDAVIVSIFANRTIPTVRKLTPMIVLTATGKG